MDKPLRPAQIWALHSPDPNQPYYALVVCRGTGGPRQYAPEEKRKIGLRADGLSAFTFQPAGLLCEGTTATELADYVKSHTEIFATREQLDAYYAKGDFDARL